MTLSHRAPVAALRPLAALALCAMAASASCFGQTSQRAPAAGNAAQAVKVFDFNERPLGNFEDTPMYWHRLTGEGLPAYSAGQLDEEVGHAAPPSFRFTLRGGNIAYEYDHDDLPVSSDCDYLVEGWVRAEDLTYARAFIALYLVDAAGQRIAGSEHVSPLAWSESPENASPAWQRLAIPLYVDEPAAASLRLQLWVLQSYVFAEPDPDAVDPITLQDVDARVWFDDLSVLRLPRITLSLSNPGGLVQPGAAETLQLDIQNTTPLPLTAELAIAGPGQSSGGPRLSQSFSLTAGSQEQFRLPLPELAPGVYQARGRVLADDEHHDLVADRTIRFAVLPELEGRFARATDLGVDLGPWSPVDPAGAVELLKNLGCGAIKIGLPIGDVTVEGAAGTRLRQARDLAQQMAVVGIETTAVLLPRATTTDPLPLFGTLGDTDAIHEQVGPMCAYLAGCLSSLQLGAESDEFRHPAGWSAEALDNLRQQLQRYAAVPPLIVPRSILDLAASPALLAENERPATATGPIPSSAAISSYSIGVPPELPTSSLPWYLATLFDPSQAPDAAPIDRACGLSLGVPRESAVSPDDQLIDLSRRLILAKAANVGRIYIPAPLEYSTSSGRPAWQPTEQYVALRTLFHALGGARPIAALHGADDACCLLFQRDRDYALAAWTWREGREPTTIELYLRPGPRAQISLFPAPQIIAGVDGPLLQLEDSFHIAPALLQLHDPQPPVLSLINPYDTMLTGVVKLVAPSEWQVTPNPVRLQLAPGQALRQPLTFDVPPRQIAAEQKLQATLCLQQPSPAELELVVPLQIGLEDIVVQATAWWAGDDLLVLQSLRNLSDDEVSFDAFCQPVGRPQLEAAFLHIPPGEAQDHTYVLPAARELAEGQLWLCVQEIGGRRSLNQLLPVPP